MRTLRTSLRWTGLMAVLFAVGCAQPEPPEGLSGMHRSKEALAEAVLTAIRSDSAPALDDLRLTRREYLTKLWPEMPEARYRALHFDLVWQVMDTNSRKGIRAAMNRFGGEDFELVGLAFQGEPEVYDSYTLHKGGVLRVRRLSDGQEGDLPVVDVVLEYDGWWKLMNVEEG